MNEQEYIDLMQGIIADLQANLPKVTGNMVRNTRMIVSFGEEVSSKIEINVPYANFVNYGYEKHPKSKKLERDYKIVERTIKNSINARTEGAVWM